MPIITVWDGVTQPDTSQAGRLKRPPKPLPQDVRLIKPDGKPTKEFHDYLTAVYEWQRRLYGILTE